MKYLKLLLDLVLPTPNMPTEREVYLCGSSDIHELEFRQRKLMECGR